MMAQGAMVAICQFGGEFISNSDGSMMYTGGEAHIVDIDQNFSFDDFKSEISSVLNVDISNMAIKYFLPANKRTLITVSCDKDLKRMIALNSNSEAFEFYVVNKPGSSNKPLGVLTDTGTSIIVNDTSNRNAGRQKRASGNSSSGRAPKSRNRLSALVPLEVPAVHVADLKINPEINQNIDGENNTRNFPMDMDFPVVPISTAVTAGEQDPCVVDALFDSVNGTTPTESVPPYLPSPDDIIACIGQEFDNVKDFRDKLAEFAINKGFTYKFIKNEPTRLTVKCTGENCPWRLHASQLPRRKKFMIKRLNNVHTCGGIGDKDDQRRVAKKMLVNFIKEKLRCSPDCKPKDIAEDIYREYGVNVNYFKIWRAKTDAEKELFSTHIVACNQLPWFCERILESNPGSVVTLATSADSKFRVFVSFHASLYGFEHGCRPLLILDRIPLKKSSQLRVLVAASVDGDDGIFPVAFSVVEEESYGSWLWFLEQLKYVAPTSRTITFISNRQNGLEEAVPQVYEDSFHCYCLIHLLEEFKIELKKGDWPQKVMDEMVSDLECAAQACLVEDFNAYIEKINGVSKEAADWVIATKPEHWANALFRGQRYNHISADIVEFTDWILVKHESSALLMIDALRSKTMQLMHSRQEVCSSWVTTLTPTMELKLKKEMSVAQKFDVLCSSETVFEVRGRNVNVINIGACECTCRRWQIIGLPCVHAIAVFEHLNKNVYDYCSRYFRTDCYRLTYSQSIQQILDPERMSAIARANLCPPTTRQLKWPRRKRDRRKQGPVRPLHCSRCKGAGHNKATCETYPMT